MVGITWHLWFSIMSYHNQVLIVLGVSVVYHFSRGPKSLVRHFVDGGWMNHGLEHEVDTCQTETPRGEPAVRAR